MILSERILSEMLAELDYNTSMHDAVNRGEEIGKEKLLLEEVSEGIVTEEYAAKKLNISLEEFRSICKK